MESRHKEGEIVYAKEAPNQKLTVRRYVDEIYYCIVEGAPTYKEVVYFERELIQQNQNVTNR